MRSRPLYLTEISGERYRFSTIRSEKSDGVDFSGTNTVERIAASSEVLLQMSGKNCLCIAASHDIELTFILAESYRNVHFQESITDDGIVFDYKLYEGRASSRNAIKLLGLMGYDSKIVDEAKKRADRFADHGSWTS